jgi:malonyl CoA-acyl carrier protein transacylase
MLLDDLLDGYVDWRESARAVADAYARWSFASGPERVLRFAAFAATLDREQKTAAAYAEAVTDVERWLQRSDSHRGLWS